MVKCQSHTLLTSLTSLDEEHLRLPFQTFAVDVAEVIDHVKNANRLRVARVQTTQFTMGHEDAGEGAVFGVVYLTGRQEQSLERIKLQVVVYLHLEPQVFKHYPKRLYIATRTDCVLFRTQGIL